MEKAAWRRYSKEYLCTPIYNCPLELNHYFDWCTCCYMESFDSIFNHFQNFFVELSLLSWQECVHEWYHSHYSEWPVCSHRPIIVKIWVNIFGAVLNVSSTNHLNAHSSAMCGVLVHVPSRYICLCLISAAILSEVRNTFQKPGIFTNFSCARQFKIRFLIFAENVGIKIADPQFHLRL